MESHFPFKQPINNQSNTMEYATSYCFDSTTTYTESILLNINTIYKYFPFPNTSFDLQPIDKEISAHESSHTIIHISYSQPHITPPSKENPSHQSSHTIIPTPHSQPHITPITSHRQPQPTSMETSPPHPSCDANGVSDQHVDAASEMVSHSSHIIYAPSSETLQVSQSLFSHLPSSNQDSIIVTRSKNNIVKPKNLFNLSTPYNPH